MQDKGPPKSITVEDSFKDCSSLAAAEHVIKVLAPDLLARMVEDYQVTLCSQSYWNAPCVTVDMMKSTKRTLLFPVYVEFFAPHEQC